MPQREPKPRPATAHVTVYKDDGTPVQYPKAQLHRIDESQTLFLEDHTAVDPGETPAPKPAAKAKKPSAKTGSK